MQARPTRRSRLADQVALQVRDLIASGAYHVGDRLPNESELSERFGVGRSTVREAMRVLSSRGLIDVRHGDGTYVAARTLNESLEERLNRAELSDIYEARLMLESALSVLAAQRRNAKDVTAMRKFLKARDAAIRGGDVAAYANADFDFHLAVAKAAKNPALFEVYESFVQSVSPRLQSATTEDYIRNEGDRMHAALCDAIAEGDVAETRRLVRLHLKKSAKDLGNALG
jgi:DNA-binding FadR family transcriptional regulator